VGHHAPDVVVEAVGDIDKFTLVPPSERRWRTYVPSKCAASSARSSGEPCRWSCKTETGLQLSGRPPLVGCFPSARTAVGSSTRLRVEYGGYAMPCRRASALGSWSRCSAARREYQHTRRAAVTATRAGAATLPRPKGAGRGRRVRDGTSAAARQPAVRKTGPVPGPPYRVRRLDGVTVAGGPACVKDGRQAPTTAVPPGRASPRTRSRSSRCSRTTRS